MIRIVDVLVLISDQRNRVDQYSTFLSECEFIDILLTRMRKFKRIIHKQFGSVGNFFAIVILVAITVIFINSYVLPKRNRMC